jgi:hypothetical protein
MVITSFMQKLFLSWHELHRLKLVCYAYLSNCYIPQFIPTKIAFHWCQFWTLQKFIYIQKLLGVWWKLIVFLNNTEGPTYSQNRFLHNDSIYIFCQRNRDLLLFWHRINSLDLL